MKFHFRLKLCILFKCISRGQIQFSTQQSALINTHTHMQPAGRSMERTKVAFRIASSCACCAKVTSCVSVAFCIRAFSSKNFVSMC
eukprot:m.163403 g.163403  ORF g.163403 m.163403 type:complete len:86 (+) comp14383_c0_seq3:1275-1532(+)